MQDGLWTASQGVQQIMLHEKEKYDEWESIAREWMTRKNVSKSEIEACILALQHSGRPILAELKEAKKRAKSFKDLMG